MNDPAVLLQNYLGGEPADTQILALAGFWAAHLGEPGSALARLDPAKFADAALAMADAGLPAVYVIEFLLGPLTGRHATNWEGYLRDFTAALNPPPADVPDPLARPQGPPPTTATSPVSPSLASTVRIPVAAADYDRVDWLLRAAALEGLPVPGRERGAVLCRFEAPLPDVDGMTAAVSLVNADAGPVLDAYLAHGACCLGAAPPGRSLANPLVIPYGGGAVTVTLVRQPPA